MTFSQSFSDMKSPLMYSPNQFVDKLVERGCEFDFDLRNQINNSLSNLGNFNNLDDKINAHMNYWNEYISDDNENKKYLAHLGKIFCNLEKYNIPYVNYLVIFYYFSQNEIKNLYRNYYIEWKHIEQQLNQTNNKIGWTITPRDFNKLKEKELTQYWMTFLNNIIVDSNSICYILFILNKLYQYVTPN